MGARVFKKRRHVIGQVIPGAMLGYSNTLETFRGRLMTPKRTKRAIQETSSFDSLRPLRLQTRTILEFDFRMSPGQALQAAYIKVR